MSERKFKIDLNLVELGHVLAALEMVIGFKFDPDNPTHLRRRREVSKLGQRFADVGNVGDEWGRDHS